MTQDVVYKLVAAEDWRRAAADGVVAPSEIDRRDGYIHLSGPDQVLDTADRYFGAVANVVALEIPLSAIDGALRFELAPKRGALFPHLYGALRTCDVARARPLARVDGRFRFADGA